MVLSGLKEIETHILSNPHLSDYESYETSPLLGIQELISRNEKREAKRKAKRTVIAAYKGKGLILARRTSCNDTTSAFSYFPALFSLSTISRMASTSVLPRATSALTRAYSSALVE